MPRREQRRLDIEPSGGLTVPTVGRFLLTAAACRTRAAGEDPESRRYSHRTKRGWPTDFPTVLHDSAQGPLRPMGIPVTRTLASGVSRRRPARRKVRYAVVGLGHIAQAAVLPAFGHAERNSELRALVSGDAGKRSALGRRYGVSRLCGYADYNELLARGQIDAVYLTLPNDMHKDFAVRAARAGVHVLCEKPMAVIARDCEQMIRAAELSRVKLMVAYRLHFERANLQAGRIARQGRLGALRFFSSDFSMQVREDNIRLERARGGGPLYDIGIYCINAARYCLGEQPVAVWAAAARSRDPHFREIDETVIGMMRYRDERLASFTVSFGAADRSTYTVVGTRGSITLDPAYEYAEGLRYQLRPGRRRPTLRQAIRLPAVPREPKLVRARSASR